MRKALVLTSCLLLFEAMAVAGSDKMVIEITGAVQAAPDDPQQAAGEATLPETGSEGAVFDPAAENPEGFVSEESVDSSEGYIMEGDDDPAEIAGGEGAAEPDGRSGGDK